MSPERVLMIRPELGEKPMEVSMETPVFDRHDTGPSCPQVTDDHVQVSRRHIEKFRHPVAYIRIGYPMKPEPPEFETLNDLVRQRIIIGLGRHCRVERGIDHYIMRNVRKHLSWLPE